MAPLQGHTLGERHKYYNQLVNEALANKPAVLPKINYENDDVDNMIRIDIACSERNVDYILDVFKCDDMLYVSRAICKSTWLITDSQYANIINPEYLHKSVFPQMNAKAVTKLMLHIRRHLKDENRLVAFYSFVKERNSKAALHWLQNCPLELIKSVVKTSSADIPVKLLKRLFRRSISIFRVFCSTPDKSCFESRPQDKRNMIPESLFLLKSNTEEFFDIVDGYYFNYYVYFDAKKTSFLMKKNSQRVFRDFKLYYQHIDKNTFVKFITPEKAETLLSIHFAALHSCDRSRFDNLSPLLSKMHRDRVIPVLRSALKIRDDDEDDDVGEDDDDGAEYASACSNSSSNHSQSDESDNSENSDDSDKSDDSSNVQKLLYALENTGHIHSSVIYRWYQYIPFELAFPDITKLILAESSPEERNAMLIVLLNCASYNIKYVITVLEYYFEKHINEIYKHKIGFINNLLAKHNTFRFDDSTWAIVNKLFQSLEVYVESDNDVQNCIIAVIIDKVLKEQPVPEIVEEKFEFETLRKVKRNLNDQEQNKLFNYLYKLMETKLLKQETDSETGVHEAIEMIKQLWSLLNDWGRTETHHHILIDKIAELGVINKTSSWHKAMPKCRKKRRNSKFLRRKRRGNCYSWRYRQAKIPPEPYINLPLVYKMVKSYRRNLFEKSLILHDSEEACLNALKHDPELLTRHKNEVEVLRSDDDICLKRFLRKLRIYWPDTLAAEWTETNMKLTQNSTGLRALVRGVIILLPQNKLVEYVKKYVPTENKVLWNEIDENYLSLQKHISKHMHLARPQLPAEVVLWYAKGDYLQYALLSLNTIYYNLRSDDIQKFINILLKAPVSLRKHGIRLAFAKFKTCELINQLPIMWKSSRNSSIRALLFTRLFALLCNEKKATYIEELWTILSMCIDSLNHEENRIIYTTLGQAKDVPIRVFARCYVKAFLFLKSLPPKVDLDNTLDVIIKYAANFIEYLDPEFVENILLPPPYDFISNNTDVYMNILVCYLLRTRVSNIQMQKYNNLLNPVVQQCIPKWLNNEEGNIKNGCQNIMQRICKGIPHFVIEKKMVMPVEILCRIQNALTKGLVNRYNDYKILARWRLAVSYVKLLDSMIKNSERSYTWRKLLAKSSRKLAELCVLQFTEDINELFPSIYLVYTDVLYNVFNDFDIVCYKMSRVLIKMLHRCNNPSVYLLVTNILPNMYHYKYHSVYRCRCKLDIIRRKIYRYPSIEVKMHYFQAYQDQSQKFTQVERQNSEDTVTQSSNSEDD